MASATSTRQCQLTRSFTKRKKAHRSTTDAHAFNTGLFFSLIWVEFQQTPQTSVDQTDPARQLSR